MRKFYFYIHIGTEKTGSTTIQNVLKQTSNDLQNAGFAYLVTHGRIESRAFAAAAINDKQPDDFLQSIDKQSSEERQALREQLALELQDFTAQLPVHVHSIILSSEHFHSRLRHPRDVQWLHDFLLPYASRFTIICYLRPQAELVASSYSTMLKNNDTRSFHEVVEKICLPSNHYYNYQKILNLWAGVFAHTSIVPRVFSIGKFLKGDVVADFFNIIGVHDDFYKQEKHARQRLNESLSPVGQLILRTLNIAGKEYKKSLSDNQYIDCEALIETFKVKVISSFSGKGEAVNDAQFERIERDFWKSNEQVGLEWFDNDKALLATKPCFENKVINSYCPSLTEPQLLLLEEVVAFLDELDGRYLVKLDPLASVFRDIAVMRENKSLEIAYRWMCLAQRIRPNGPFINRKVDAYQSARNHPLYRLKRIIFS